MYQFRDHLHDKKIQDEDANSQSVRKASFSGSVRDAGVLRKGYRCKIHKDVATMHS